MTRIRLLNSDIKTVLQHIKANKKIAAIKHLRDNGKNLDDPHERVSLKQAKLAVESLVAGTPCTEVQIIPEWTVHSLVVSGECGNRIELDLETLQMHFLSSLDKVGLSEVGHLLDLVDYIRRWQARAHTTDYLRAEHNED